MKGFQLYLAVIIMLLCQATVGMPALAHANQVPWSTSLNEWQMLWEEKGTERTIQEVTAKPDEEGWFAVSEEKGYPARPEGINSAWLKFVLPEMKWSRAVLHIQKLYALDVVIYIDEQVVYEFHRDYPYQLNKILVPLSSDEAGRTVYLKINSSLERMGLFEPVYIGEYQMIAKDYMKEDVFDLILGTALMFISLSMMMSVVFLKRFFLPGWYALCLVMLSIGLMILTYSSYLHMIFSEFGKISYYLFDVASTLLMPMLFLFFERIFSNRSLKVLTVTRKILVALSAVNIMGLILNICIPETYSLYSFIATVSFGISIVMGNLILIITMIVFCRKGNNEAIIMTVGYGIFAGICILELAWFFMGDSNYRMFYWKLGILIFLASLVIILARRIMKNYEQVVKYSKQLEVFNNELQRSEKMEMLSQLAASVAHEVRNPLQVTRGFLQLLGERTAVSKDKTYMLLAIDELDRASAIITDFLTFAKPEIDKTSLLNIEDELKQIEGILNPLAMMQGSVIQVESEADLHVRGNSSKLKQALINIIKNSLEALSDNATGMIHIKAQHDPQFNEVMIWIQDNGEGMSEADLKRLGEPYYSRKTKGTGLGLMVTYRIIEAMNGRISFKSTLGSGTEATIYLPVEKK